MKIRLLSDLHTEGGDFVYHRLDEDVLVLAGDIGVGAQTVKFIKSKFPKDLPIVFIAGNHEFYKHDFNQVKKLFTKEFKDTNVHYLDNSEVVLDGVRFLGSTMFSNFGLHGETERWFSEHDAKRYINDFQIIWNGEYTWSIEDHKKEFEKAYKYMQRALDTTFNGKTVVVSHFLPTNSSVHPCWKNSSLNPYFASDCENLIGFSELWLHGHTHDSCDYTLYGTRIVCNPRGYGVENKTDFNPNLILEI
jgi:calcineurin-like phosphoesterase family protein